MTDHSSASAAIDGSRAGERRAIVGYAAPLVLFAAYGTLEEFVPRALYPQAYFVKILMVMVALLVWRAPLRDITWSWRQVAPSMLVGLAVIAAWIGIDVTLPYPHLGSRVGFDPSSLEPSMRASFLAVRFFGLVVIVPVMEELFWRSFILRYMTGSPFWSIPIGTFSASAFWTMVAGSAMTHSEWLVALIAGAAYGFWVKRTRSVFAAVVAHATSNAVLGVYVLTTHDWRFW